jgi:hypothetical protein
VRIVLGLGLVLVLSGCSSATPAAPAVDGTVASFHLSDLLAHNATRRLGRAMFVEDPDVLLVNSTGAYEVPLAANRSFRITLVQPSLNRAPDWLVVAPRGYWTDAATCRPPPSALRMRSFATTFDSITGSLFAPGNWSLLVLSQGRANFTVSFNTTLTTKAHLVDGTMLAARLLQLEPDLRVESSQNPYRTSFNKTFHTDNRSLFLGAARVYADASQGFEEIRSKIESDAFLCAQHRVDAAAAASTFPQWQSQVATILGPGTHSFAGRFNAQWMLNPHWSSVGAVVVFNSTA